MEPGGTSEAPASLLVLLHSVEPPDDALVLRTALSSPDRYLAELKEIEMHQPALFIKQQALIRLVQGELLLALQKDSAALLCFREVQQRIAHFLQQRGGIPFIPLPRGTPRTVPNSADNWLIQRFLTLKDHDNALSEFNRVWDILNQKLKTYAVSVKQPDGRAVVSIVEPCGFDAYSLHFTQCFATFLNAQRQRIRAIDVLLRAALALDLDHSPSHPPTRQLGPNEALPPGVPILVHFDTPASARLTRRDFLRHLIGEFERMNQLPVLMRELFKAARSRNHVHLTIAFCMSALNASQQDVMDMELDYLHGLKTDAITRAYRAGLIFEAHNMKPAAVAHFELAAKSPWTGWPQLPGTDDVEHFGGDPNAKRSRGEFIKLVVSKLICLYQELKGEDSVQRLLDLLEWQFEDCPELLEQFNMLEMSEHYFREYKETDRFAKWIRRLPTLGATWRAQGNIALLLGDYDTLSRLLTTAASEGKMDFTEYLRWRNAIINQHVTHTTEDGLSFGVLRSSTKNLACAHALLAAMLKRFPTDRNLLDEQQELQDFCVIP